MDGAGRGENHGAAGRECQPDQSLAGDFQVGLRVGSDFYDAARAGKRGRDVKIAVGIESQALRTSQAFDRKCSRVPLASILYTRGRLVRSRTDRLAGQRRDDRRKR